LNLISSVRWPRLPEQSRRLAVVHRWEPGGFDAHGKRAAKAGDGDTGYLHLSRAGIWIDEKSLPAPANLHSTDQWKLPAYNHFRPKQKQKKPEA